MVEGWLTYTLGVDLGTTYSAAAILRDREAAMVGLGVRSLEVPSVVFLREDGEFLVGEAAERRGLTEPGRLAREFKRRIGDPVPVLLAGSPYSAQALTARLLRWIVAAVTAREGGPPLRTIVTHPANWGQFKRDLLEQAVQLADVDDVRLAPEPLAAAVHYSSTTRVSPGDTVAVYDLGGGTFDAAILRKTSEWFEVLGRPEGIEHLGGIDFDEAVFGYVVRTLGDRLQVDRSDPAAVAGIARLRRECVDAKEALSVDTDVSIPVLLPTVQTEIRLTRGEFEAMIRPSIADTIGAMRRTLRSANVDGDALKAVVLVGGSGRIPLVGEMVHAELGVPIAVDTHPKHSVALGAARLAGVAELPVAKKPEPGPPAAVPPPAEESPPVATASPAVERPPKAVEPPAAVPEPPSAAEPAAADWAAPSAPPPAAAPPGRQSVPPSMTEPKVPPLAPAASKRSGRLALIAIVAIAAIALVAVVSVFVLGGDGDGGARGNGSTTTLGGVSTTPAPVSSVPPDLGAVTCEPLKVALFVDLSGGGDIDYESVRNAAELAVTEFVEANPQCPVTLTTLDTQGSAERAAQLAQGAVGDSAVIGVVMAVLSDNVLTAGPILDDGGLPFVVSAAKNSSLDEQGWTMFSRILGDDFAQSHGAATFLRDDLGATSVVVVDDGSAQGQMQADLVQEDLGELSVERTTLAPDGANTQSVIDAAASTGASAVYFGGTFDRAGSFLVSLRASGYAGEFVMPEGVATARLAETAGADAEGAFITCSCAPPDGSPDFVSAYRDSVGSDPSGYAPETFDATNVLLAGVGDGADDRAEMATFVRAFEAEGITKDVAFDEQGEIVGSPTYVYRIEAGLVVSQQFVP